MFSIQHTDTQRRRAVIQIDSFKEEFESSGDLLPNSLDELWKNELTKLRRRTSIVLPCWIRNGIVSRGWVIWKDNEKAHIQDMLFPDGFTFGKGRVPKRVTVTEEGLEVSEWTTEIESIESFLSQKGQNQATHGTTSRLRRSVVRGR